RRRVAWPVGGYGQPRPLTLIARAEQDGEDQLAVELVPVRLDLAAVLVRQLDVSCNRRVHALQRRLLDALAGPLAVRLDRLRLDQHHEGVDLVGLLPGAGPGRR